MSDLDLIKKYYGEDMAHFCRSNFFSILETEGLLYNLLDSHFAHNKFLYDDIVSQNKLYSFKELIYSFMRPKEVFETTKNPFELMDDAGYLLYECNTEEEIQAFKKYYAKGEELCTFKGGRLNKCYVFFAVKKDVNSIKRENFKYPLRQDRYGTSVISIQFDKGNVNTLSIKNRYNHRVVNPDSTFSNDLENIIAGLTKSFEKYYGLKINSNKNNFELSGYVLANDKKYYKYNYEINNIYYCTNNIIIDNFNVIDLYKAKERFIVFDYFILDMKYKKLYLYNKAIDDSFPKRFLDIEKITIEKENKEKIIHIKTSEGNADITLSKDNRMIKYYDDISLDIVDNFLCGINNILELKLINTKSIKDGFLYNGSTLERIDLPNVEIIGDEFLYWNRNLKEINLPKLKNVSDDFLGINNSLKELDLPNLMLIGNDFLADNNSLKKINLPNAIIIGKEFLCDNQCLTEINIPKLKEINRYFLYHNNILEEIDLPNVEVIDDDFLSNNKVIKKINAPKLLRVGSNFLTSSNYVKFEESKTKRL